MHIAEPTCSENISTYPEDEINLKQEVASIISALYDNPIVPRNIVQSVVDGINMFYELKRN